MLTCNHSTSHRGVAGSHGDVRGGVLGMGEETWSQPRARMQNGFLEGALNLESRDQVTP